MRYLHSTGGASIADVEQEIAMEANVSHAGADAFKADWIEVVNGGANPLLANPYGTMNTLGSVVIPAGKTYRFEWGPENEAARDKGGWGSVFLLSNVAGTTAYVTAGAE